MAQDVNHPYVNIFVWKKEFIKRPNTQLQNMPPANLTVDILPNVSFSKFTHRFLKCIDKTDSTMLKKPIQGKKGPHMTGLSIFFLFFLWKS